MLFRSIALALVSGYLDAVIPSDIVAIGEVGLSGEVRAVGQTAARVKEAAKLGFKRIIVPASAQKSIKDAEGISVIGVNNIREAVAALKDQAAKNADAVMPGYTHLQVAMPSSFGLWFGAYAESLADDMTVMKGAWDVNDRNPLGSAAGYGSSAPLDRKMTTELLGFSDLDYNSVYAQMGRGKVERIVSFAYACLAETVGRLAMDCCLFNSQNFGFVKLPDALTTGSSIMPHKKNPDVFELIRAHCNRIQGIPNDIRLVTGNLPSGYFRDMQLLKEVGKMLSDKMFFIENIDATIIAQRPKFRPYIDKMVENIAGSLLIDVSQVNVKATTEEHLGFTGREEGIAAEAVCLIAKPSEFSYDVTNQRCSSCCMRNS